MKNTEFVNPKDHYLSEDLTQEIKVFIGDDLFEHVRLTAQYQEISFVEAVRVALADYVLSYNPSNDGEE